VVVASGRVHAGEPQRRWADVKPELLVRPSMRPEDEGGRHGPFTEGYCPHFVDGTHTSACSSTATGKSFVTSSIVGQTEPVATMSVFHYMPKRVVVAFPKIESAIEWKQLLSVRERFDPLAGRIAPHLTLVFPFEDTMSDLALEQHLRNVVTDLPRFPVTLREITAHENEYLFLNVKRGNDALIHLHDALYTGALAAHRVRMHTFVPHVTVGRLLPEDLPAALDATADVTSAIHANVDTISVYRIEPDGMRPALFELPLKTP